MDMKKYWETYDEYVAKFDTEFPTMESNLTMEDRYSVMRNCIKHNKPYKLKDKYTGDIVY